jgi:transposase
MGWKASGNRIKRGLYRTYDGFVVNADLNGAANILKKVSGRLGLSLNQLSRRSLAVVARIRLN